MPSYTAVISHDNELPCVDDTIYTHPPCTDVLFFRSASVPVTHTTCFRKALSLSRRDGELSETVEYLGLLLAPSSLLRKYGPVNIGRGGSRGILCHLQGTRVACSNSSLPYFRSASHTRPETA